MTDIAVMAITFGGTLELMTSLDLAWAAPFSTAIHPFTAAVQILLNKMNGVMDSFTPAEYMAGAADDYRIIRCKSRRSHHTRSDLCGPDCC